MRNQLLLVNVTLRLVAVRRLAMVEHLYVRVDRSLELLKAIRLVQSFCVAI
jgi:hypothetical protein